MLKEYVAIYGDPGWVDLKEGERFGENVRDYDSSKSFGKFHDLIGYLISLRRKNSLVGEISFPTFSGVILAGKLSTGKDKESRVDIVGFSKFFGEDFILYDGIHNLIEERKKSKNTLRSCMQVVRAEVGLKSSLESDLIIMTKEFPEYKYFFYESDF